MTVVELKKIKDAYQTVSNRSLKTEEPSDTTKSVDTTKPVAAETQSAAVEAEAAVIDVKAAAEEHEDAVAVQELTKPVTDQPKSVEAEFDEVVDAVEAVKDESVEAKAVETKIIEVDSMDVEDVVHPESNDKEAVAASVETEVADEETTVSDDVKENLLAEAVTRTEPTESEVVVAEVNSDVKAAIEFSDKVSADKEGARNEGLTAHATDEEPANERISAETSDEIASVIEANANKAVAVEKAADDESLDEAELVTKNMDLSVEVIVTDQTVEEVAAEAVADSRTDDEAFSTEIRFSAEGDIERKVAEVIKDKAVPVGEEVEMDEAAVKEVDAAAAAPITEIDEAVVNGTETASNTEIPEVFVEEAETEAMPSEDIGNVEVEAVENELATEKLEEIEQSDDEMPKEARAVAAVENAAAIVKDSDNESAPTKQPPVVKSTPADDNPVAVNLGTSTICEYEETESLKSSDQFEVDTKPISAVTTLIGRFEHIAKHNATEAGNSRTSSRNSSRVSSPLPSPPSSWSRGNAFETVAKSDNAIENFEEPVSEESNKENEDVLTDAEADQTEVEKTATVAVSVVESAAFEETPAIREQATNLSVTETVADEKAPAAKQSLVVEAGASIMVKAEAADEKSDEIEDNIVVEVGVVEPKLIDESTEAEVKVEKTLAAEVKMVESFVEPEAEDVDLETSTEEETPGVAEEANVPASAATEAYKALEEVPVADMAEADLETSETQMISAVYKPTEASILSVDGVEVDAVWHEAVTNVEEVAEDVAPSGTSFVDVDEAVATADFTTDEAVTTRSEEASSEFVSAMKETHAIYTEIQESQVEQKEVSQPMEMMSVRTDDGTLTDEATVVMALMTSPVAMALTSPVTKTMERKPERSSSPVIPYEQLTYEILGVTRANNVIMYHVYMINHATGEQAMSIPKRYSEFKLLDEQLRTLNVPSGRGLPVLPKPSVGTFLRGRRSQKTIEMREKAFGDFLHYVRDHDELHQSIIFQQFIAH